jgi:hypothetical protein
MTRLLLIAATLPLAACFITPDHDPVPLASMTRTSVALTASNDAPLIDPGSVTPTLAVQLDTSPIGNEGDPADCPTISSDATATFDGLPLTLDDAGGWDAPIDGGSQCHAIRWSLATAPAHPGQSSQLVIRDATTTWTVEAKELLTNDFALQPSAPAGHAQIAWTSAPAIDGGAYVQFTDSAGTLVFAGALEGYPNGVAVTVTGNVVDVAIPQGTTRDGTLSINAARTPQATRCDGPAGCDLLISAGADLPMTLP